MPNSTSIPVLDVGAIFAEDSNAKKALADEFARVYGTIGFGYIVNHGIDRQLREDIFAVSKAFQAQPHKVKMQMELNHLHRGYIAINTSTDVNSKLAKVTRPNQSESFMLMREDNSELPRVYLSGPNQWPDLPGFRDTCETYVKAMSDLGNRLMKIALLASGAEPETFMHAFEAPTTWLRLLHYPARPNRKDDMYGSAPHTDFGCLTLLAQDPVGGLQVKTAGGDWLDAPFMKDAFVVNVGDMLHRLSNGRLRSTPHRVINPSGSERYSVPFFYDPHVSAEIRPLAGTGKPRFKPINFGTFLRGELEAGYDTRKNNST